MMPTSMEQQRQDRAAFTMLIFGVGIGILGAGIGILILAFLPVVASDSVSALVGAGSALFGIGLGFTFALCLISKWRYEDEGAER